MYRDGLLVVGGVAAEIGTPEKRKLRTTKSGHGMAREA